MQSTTRKRMLFTVLPAYGHVYPLLPLASACRDAGHEVHVATGGDFVHRLGDLGFSTHLVGMPIEQAQEMALERPGMRGLPPDQIFRFAAAFFGDVLARATTSDLVPLVATIEPDLVVYEEYEPGAALAARLAGVPSVAHALGRQPPDFLRAAVNRELARVWREMSVEPFVDPFVTDAYIDISPPALRDATVAEPALRLSQRSVAQTDSDATLPSWVTRRPPRPLVYVTLGTVSFGAVDSLRRVVDGLARLDVDVLVTVGPAGDAAHLGPLPPNVRAERFVPQDALLPHVDLAVHHCGSGTMLGVLAQGIPALAVPHGADQFMNAEALQRSGAGTQLVPDEIAPHAVAAHVRGLLGDPTYRSAARAIAREIAAMPDPEAVVPTLVRIAEDGIAARARRSA